MKNFKALVVAAALSMIAGVSYADPTDLSSVTDVSLDFAGRNDAITALDFSTDPEDNVALINQDGSTTLNHAWIDQSGGTGNVAIIKQDGANNANSAYIGQVGNANRATINQH